MTEKYNLQFKGEKGLKFACIAPISRKYSLSFSEIFRDRIDPCLPGAEVTWRTKSPARPGPWLEPGPGTDVVRLGEVTAWLTASPGQRTTPLTSRLELSEASEPGASTVTVLAGGQLHLATGPPQHPGQQEEDETAHFHPEDRLRCVV